MNRTYVSLDLETTGLDNTKHGIIQIGAVATGDGAAKFKGYFLRDVNPGSVSISKEALDVNGFTEERIREGQPIREALKDFNDFLYRYKQTETDEVYVVGQNVPFDVAWLIKDFRTFGYDVSIFRRVIDNASLGFVRFGELMGQGRLAEKLDMKNTFAHDALADAFTASNIFHALRVTE